MSLKIQRSNSNAVRWAINLQSDAADIRVNDGAMPFVTLKTGVLFTPDLSKKVLKPKFKRPPATVIDMEHFAPELAVAIDPPRNTSVKLEWAALGQLTIPFAGDDPNTRYTVYFINEPPNLVFDPHFELPLYYMILQRNGAPIPEAEQCKLEFDIPPLFRLDQIPCNPVRLDP